MNGQLPTKWDTGIRGDFSPSCTVYIVTDTNFNLTCKLIEECANIILVKFLQFIASFLIDIKTA